MKVNKGVDHCHQIKDEETKAGLAATSASQKEAREEEETSMYEGKKELESKQKARNSTCGPTLQEPHVPIKLEEFFPLRFLRQVTVNMKRRKMERGEQRNSQIVCEKTLTNVKGLPVHMSLRKIIYLPEEMS